MGYKGFNKFIRTSINKDKLIKEYKSIINEVFVIFEYEWWLMNIKEKELCIDKLGYKGFNELVRVSIKSDELKENYKSIIGKDFVQYKYIDDYYEGFARVELLDSTWNFIDNKGNILSKYKFKFVHKFSKGFAIVQLLDGNWNYIDKEGNLLSKEQNFIFVDYFNDGFARVKILDGGYNFIDKQGNLLSKEQNFKNVDYFKEGFAVVETSNGEYFYVDDQSILYAYNPKTIINNN